MPNSFAARCPRCFVARLLAPCLSAERPAKAHWPIPKLMLCFVCLSLLFAVLSSPTFAQTYPFPGFPPFSTQIGGPYDSINLADSLISVSLPLRTKSGPIAFSSLMFGASNAFTFTEAPEQPAGHTYWVITFPSFVPLTSVGAVLSWYPSTPTTCNGVPDNYYSAFTVTDSSGTPHPLSSVIVIDSGGCLPIPSGPVHTIDGSGYTVVFTGRVTYELYDKFGNTFPSSGSMTTPDGVSLLTGINGQIETVTDSLTSTPVLTETYSATAGQPITYEYADAAGNPQTYTVNYSSYTQATNFGCSGVADTALPRYLPTEITTPAGNYTITYETTPNYSNSKYPPPYWTGRITEIQLPSGGAISYTYAGGNNGINCTSWVVPTLTRTVSDGAGHSSKWTYVNSNTSGTLGSYDIGATFTVTETDPGGNQTVHYYEGQYQTQTMAYEGGCPTSISGCTGGGTLLRTVTTCFNGNFSNCAAPTTPINYPYSQTDVYTSTNGSSSSLVETKYDTTVGNVLEVKQYGFGAAMPPAGSPISDTVISYGQSWNGSSCSSYGTGIYIFATPCYSHTMNSSGADVAKTQITYSNTGHPTSTSQWVSGSSWLTTTATYNSNGTVATGSDVNQALSTYSYNGTGGCNNLLPTSVKVTGSGLPSAGLTASGTWNCNGGVQTSATDANTQTTTTNYELSGAADPFYRPLSVVDPLGNTTNYSYTLMNFESAMNFGTSTTDVLTTTDGLRRLILSQTRQGPFSSTLDSTATAYGWTATGPFTTVSVPYSGTAGESAPAGTAVTTTQYDALHRPVTVTDGSGGTITYSYVKNDVLQSLGPAPTGENPKRRQLEYDGLGRLTSVCEITSATGSGSGSCGQANSETGLLTNYTYDALGDVLSVTQNAQPGAIGGQQTRTYAYDGLSRMVSEANPEWNNQAQLYTYDVACGTFSASAGDLTKIVDNVGNTICYGYDALHRLAGVAYPSGSYAATTAPKTYVYDATTFSCSNPSGAFVKGLLAEAYTGSSGSKTTDLGFCYSPRGEVTDAFQESSLSGGYYHTVQSYYANGAPKQLSGVPGLAMFTYGLDGEGRPNSLSASSGQNPVTSMNYDVFGTPNVVTLGSGDSDSFVPDPNTGRMTQFNFAIGSQTFTGTPSWNSIGTLKQFVITDPFDSSDSQTCNYSHDDLSRVASMNCGSAASQNYTYDAFGNITMTGTGATQPVYSASTNRMTTLNGLTVSYDANGNLLSDGVNTYTWNADGRPTKLNSTTWTFDAFGRPVERSVGSGFQQALYVPTGDQFAFMTGQVFFRGWVPSIRTKALSRDTCSSQCFAAPLGSQSGLEDRSLLAAGKL